ncbi:MAG: hypothetical protein JWP27_1397 [Flaviaesturariibacter sp.]|nr:hypothetical protein [Flaviaesturariibacter sp.]
MGKDHRGQPSGTNKVESGTGIPTRTEPENASNDRDLTERYTDDDQALSDNVRTNHPNRNTSKDSKNGGGYSGGVSS